MTVFQNYGSDCTQVGWRIEAGPKRAVCTRRSRWQDSRDGVVITVHADCRDWLAQLAYDCETLVSYDFRGMKRGEWFRLNGERARLTHKGWIVQ